jgi:predicted DNA-binding transcriptional regulator AlpA
MNTSEFPSPQESQDAEPVVEFLTTLSALPSKTLLSESQLAQMAGRHVTSIKRAIQRGELPPPVPLLGENVWTVGAIRVHISARLEAERTAAAQTARRIQHFRPGQGGHH